MTVNIAVTYVGVSLLWL